MMDKLRRALNGNERCDEESGIITQVMDQSTLSWSTRIKERSCCICCILYFRKHYLFSQYLFFDGSTESIEEDVCGNKTNCNYISIGLYCFNIVCSFAFAQSWSSSSIYNYSVASYDMVFPIIHTICS
ncbi:PREDICTED: uncharacterized protein LOC105567209 isoform X5 [Vollenhovia emeryi]|uniref:uncharacterized protein LOC105567209 isoform X5 n=1 Tax=Vollenhovia emeryi TaxID=411798 RepID=UPI0005F3D2F0|nr:PREDICTED: uncharacterized protein LOC105567209 isoform X5 [Vollenhovia emeryi]